MKTKYLSPSRSSGSALLLVLIMCVISLVIMVAIMNRTSTVSKLNDRNNKYALCCTAAQAATEKVFARMAWDFQNYGLGQVTNNYTSGLYATNIPSANEGSFWTNFVFFDPSTGASNKIYVNFLTNYSGMLPSQYTNISTVPAPIYRITANATMAGSRDVIGTAQEDVLLSLVPITTYAIFYNGPLEFSTCATMTVRGRTHANDIIAVGTGSSLTFNNIVTSTKTISSPPRNGNTYSLFQNTTFGAGYTTNVASVTVAMNMTNAHALLEIPPTNELPTSAFGVQRLYNQAHIVLLITNLPAPTGAGANPLNPYPTPQITLVFQSSANGLVPGADGNSNLFSYLYTNATYTNTISPYKYTNNYMFTNVNFSTSQWALEPQDLKTWLSLTNTFTDRREYQTNLYVTQIDVGAYSNWLGSNSYVLTKFNSGTLPTILYVADTRNVGTNKLAVVRLVNGARLPYNAGRGFSVATPNPLYVKGNYDVTADGTHYALTPDSTTNAGTTVPAALLCDAITILSSSYTDSTSATTTGTASKSNVVNAAVVTGNVPSTGTNDYDFSGGVHNLMRLQEDWSSSTLVLNTSIVMLFASQLGTNQFRNPISGTWSPAIVNPYYNPPTRQWGFDPNFYDPAKQPPGVPTALVPIRFNWTVPPPGNITNQIGNW